MLYEAINNRDVTFDGWIIDLSDSMSEFAIWNVVVMARCVRELCVKINVLHFFF